MSEQLNQPIVRLVLEGLAVALVLALGLWGVLALGRQAVATESHYYTPAGRIVLVDAMVCLAPDNPKGSAEPVARVGKGAACPGKFRPYTSTSRQAGR